MAILGLTLAILQIIILFCSYDVLFFVYVKVVLAIRQWLAIF